MRLTTRVAAVVIGLAVTAPPTHADDMPPAIDLSTFGQSTADHAAAGDARSGDAWSGDAWSGNAWMDAGGDRADQPPVVPVANGFAPAATRVYVTGIVGASFATISTGGGSDFAGTALRQVGSVNETIFTGGGALGMAFTRDSGLLRMEVEGRARGPMTGLSSLLADGEGLPLAVAATNGWSTLTNFWRDYFFSDTFGMYAGGGFGVGGYRYTISAADDASLVGSSNVTTFAWQVGTGFVYQVSDRVTIDTGYRFFAMTPASTTLFLAGAPPIPALGIGSFSSAFSASELLLSVRICEPFRSWR